MVGLAADFWTVVLAWRTSLDLTVALPLELWLAHFPSCYHSVPLVLHDRPRQCLQPRWGVTAETCFLFGDPTGTLASGFESVVHNLLHLILC